MVSGSTPAGPIKEGETDLGELAATMIESLADLILFAPEHSQPTLMAHALLVFGQVFLEKTGAMEGGSNATH